MTIQLGKCLTETGWLSCAHRPGPKSSKEVRYRIYEKANSDELLLAKEYRLPDHQEYVYTGRSVPELQKASDQDHGKPVEWPLTPANGFGA